MQFDRLRRRDFIARFGVAAATWPLAARAQQGGGMRRIGVVMNVATDDPEALARITAFVQSLQQLGWTDGRNVQIVVRWAAGSAENSRKYAAELVALEPDVILASINPSRSSLAVGDPHRADRVRGHLRPCQRRFRRKHGKARR